MFKIFALIIFLFIFAFFGLLFYRHWKTQRSPNQAQFLRGQIPTQLPNGPMEGTVGGITTTWQGKKFDRENSKGINLFSKNYETEERYPFKTEVAKGAVDHDLDVIKIDYDIPENPIWLRFILDEIVEVEPGKYLGKVMIRFTPQLTFALGYFELKKN